MKLYHSVHYPPSALMTVHSQEECNCEIIHYRLNRHLFLRQPSKIRIQNLAQGRLLFDCTQLIQAKYCCLTLQSWYKPSIVAWLYTADTSQVLLFDCTQLIQAKYCCLTVHSWYKPSIVAWLYTADTSQVFRTDFLYAGTIT